MKKIISFLLCLNIVLSSAVACTTTDNFDNINNSSKSDISGDKLPDTEDALYSKALSLLEGGDLYGAYDIFLTIPEYEDAGEYLSRFSFKPEKRVSDYESDYEGNYSYTFYYEYDEYGKMLSTRTVYENSVEHINSYIYDDGGNLVEYQYDGVPEFKYEYDDKGNVIKLVYPSYSNDKHSYVLEIDHDKNGNIIKIIAEGGIIEKKYNEDGKVIEINKRRYTNKVQTRYYDYNEHGDLILDAFYENGKASYVDENEWEYNEAGKPTKCISTSGGKVKNRTEYTYYESGVLKEVLYFLGTNNEYQYKNEYDEKGNLIVHSIRSNDGKYNTYYYEYDEYGNPLLEEYHQSKTTYFGYKLYYNPYPAKPISDEIYGYGPGK